MRPHQQHATAHATPNENLWNVIVTMKAGPTPLYRSIWQGKPPFEGILSKFRSLIIAGPQPPTLIYKLAFAMTLYILRVAVLFSSKRPFVLQSFSRFPFRMWAALGCDYKGKLMQIKLIEFKKPSHWSCSIRFLAECACTWLGEFSPYFSGSCHGESK